MKKQQKNKTENIENQGGNIEFPSSSNEKNKRKCVGCQKIAPRVNFIKITSRFEDKKIIINPDKKTFGRSVYLCYNNDCINKAFKKNRISKILKTNIDESFIDELKSLLKTI